MALVATVALLRIAVTTAVGVICFQQEVDLAAFETAFFGTRQTSQLGDPAVQQLLL